MTETSANQESRSDLDGRAQLVDHLRGAWLGPRSGVEEVLQRSPVYAYLIGTLYPVEVGASDSQPVTLDEEVDPYSELASEVFSGVPDSGRDDVDPAPDDPDADIGLNLAGAFGWAPQSMGMSFIHNGSIRVTVRAGVYVEIDTASTPASEPPTDADSDNDWTSGRSLESHWKRRQLEESVDLSEALTGKIPVLDGRATVNWRTRKVAGLTLTTVAISNSATADPGRAKSDASRCLFQAGFEINVDAGALHPYPSGNPVNASEEDLELALRYRDKATFAIGHGVAVNWGVSSAPTRAWTDCMPTEIVPAIRARESRLDALELAWLADDGRSPMELAAGLNEFLGGYASWIVEQHAVAEDLETRYSRTASSIVERADIAIRRMYQGVELLALGGDTLTAFKLANAAMRTQMLQQGLVRATPGEIGVPLPSLAEGAAEPRWHPFQLGFILLSLPSTVDADHEDRGLVDLIWFPTGGGKTEAYLGLAAIEMIRRRLIRGMNGGGTAVITRYTMRLLTSQQFQRAATLMCALELLRGTDTRLAIAPAFSIGLWLGNATTPGTFEQAADMMKQVYNDASPGNPFQLRQCSWCATPIMPRRRSTNRDSYGVRASKYSFEMFCPHPECPFHAKLPVQVVDEGIYDEPPTMVVATVDKFARLAWTDRGQSMFGLGGSSFDAPSLVIQDELHLIAGPLGTIVGIYEAAIRGLISWKGHPAKVVASTATTRASAEQIRELMASEVAVFPPSGLDADDNYFAEPDPTRPGRMYVGVMPQAHTPSWAIGQLSTELLQGPVEVGLTANDRNGYWTLVVYHNSLRELGRTVTILRDDVRTALDRRRRVSKHAVVREMSKDGIEELNGNVSADELLRVLDQLSVGPDDGATALDALATTNIMSVGIDVGRLGLMLVNGHPKSTSEYIQATSRVGRGTTPGLVVTMFRSGKPRDRSVFESFTAYHRAFYRFVEPGSVTPWSLQARRRALRAAFVILMRHAGGLSGNDHAARFDPSSVSVQKAIQLLSEHVKLADLQEAEIVSSELQITVDDWVARADEAARNGFVLKFNSRTVHERLLKQFTDDGSGWPTMNSMRSVDRVVRVRAEGER
jgi:hypothetical protein